MLDVNGACKLLGLGFAIMPAVFVDLYSVLFASFLLFHLTKSVKFCDFYASVRSSLYSGCL